MDQIIPPHARHRAAWRPSPEIPPGCPSCGRALELAVGTELAVGVCPGPACLGLFSVWRRVEGRWVLADRTGRPAAG